jgi:hypothetical protein
LIGKNNENRLSNDEAIYYKDSGYGKRMKNKDKYDLREIQPVKGYIKGEQVVYIKLNGAIISTITGTCGAGKAYVYNVWLESEAEDEALPSDEKQSR